MHNILDQFRIKLNLLCNLERTVSSPIIKCLSLSSYSCSVVVVDDMLEVRLRFIMILFPEESFYLSNISGNLSRSLRIGDLNMHRITTSTSRIAYFVLYFNLCTNSSTVNFRVKLFHS